MDKIGRLVLGRKPGESFAVLFDGLRTVPRREDYADLEGGEEIVTESLQVMIRVDKTSGGRAKLVIEAPESVRIMRAERITEPATT